MMDLTDFSLTDLRLPHQSNTQHHGFKTKNSYHYSSPQSNRNIPTAESSRCQRTRSRKAGSKWRQERKSSFEKDMISSNEGEEGDFPLQMIGSYQIFGQESKWQLQYAEVIFIGIFKVISCSFYFKRSLLLYFSTQF